jgi:hypothetical protein
VAEDAKSCFCNTVPRQKCPCFPHQKILPPPTLLFQPYFSTIPRRALAPISGNIPHRKELSRYKRGVVLGFAGAGVIPPKIATKLNLPESTVRETLSKAP